MDLSPLILNLTCSESTCEHFSLLQPNPRELATTPVELKLWMWKIRLLGDGVLGQSFTHMHLYGGVDVYGCWRCLGCLGPWRIVEKSGRIFRGAQVCLVVHLGLHHRPLKGRHENGMCDCRACGSVLWRIHKCYGSFPQKKCLCLTHFIDPEPYFVVLHVHYNLLLAACP